MPFAVAIIRRVLLYRCRMLVGLAVALAGVACTRSSTTPVIRPGLPTPTVAGPTPATVEPASAVGIPSSAPVPAATTASGTCTDDARFVEDLTIPDGSVFTPGEAFDKRWAVRNDGTCDWGPDYRLVPIAGNPFGGAAEIALFPAQAGATGEWQIDLQAPGEPGEYLGRWQARAPDGTFFGDEVFVIIYVELATLPPSPAPTVTS